MEIVLKEVRLTVPGKWLFEVGKNGEFKITNKSSSSASVEIDPSQLEKWKHKY